MRFEITWTVACVCGWKAEAPSEEAARHIQDAHWAGHAAAFRIEIEEELG